jgi:uncharacterized repeat protein (TIGR03943 family)
VSPARALTLRAVILAVLAGGLVRLVATDAYLAYVKPSMRIPLIISVVVIGVLAIASANRADRVRHGDLDDDHEHGGHDHGGHEHGGDPQHAHAHAGHDDGHGHDHSGLPRVGWWLIAPVVCIALVPLVPLGADAVGKRSGNEVSARAGRAPAEGDDLISSGEPIAGGEVTLLDFVSQVVNDPANPFTEPVTLVGFVTEDPAIDEGFVLARFVVSCCAADAQPMLVHISYDRYAGDVPPVDTWVEVTGEHVPAPPDTTPGERIFTENVRVDATEVTVIDQPANPYETI